MAKSRKTAVAPEIRSKRSSDVTAARVSPDADLVCAGIVFTFPNIEKSHVVGDRRFSWESIADSLLDNLSREQVQRQTGTLRLEANYPAGTTTSTDAEEEGINEEFIPSIVALLKEGREQFAVAFEASERMRISAYFIGCLGTATYERGTHTSTAISHDLKGLSRKVLMQTLDTPVKRQDTGLSTPVGRGQMLPMLSPPQQESDMTNSSLSNSVPSDAPRILALFDEIENDVLTIQKPVVDRFQGILAQLEGVSLNDLEMNKLVTARIRDLLNRLGLRVECTCHQPAFLICRAVPRMDEGVFQFQHQLEGRVRTHGAFRSIPRLRLTSPAPDNRRKVLKHKDL